MKKLILILTVIFAFQVNAQTTIVNNLQINGATKKNDATRVMVQDSISKKVYWILKSGLTTDLSSYELLSNKQTNLTPSSTKYPTVNAVVAGLAGKPNTADLGATAFSNDYNDLDNLPTIPGAQNLQQTTDVGKTTTNVIKALGFMSNTMADDASSGTGFYMFSDSGINYFGLINSSGQSVSIDDGSGGIGMGNASSNTIINNGIFGGAVYGGVSSYFNAYTGILQVLDNGIAISDTDFYNGIFKKYYPGFGSVDLNLPYSKPVGSYIIATKDDIPLGKIKVTDLLGEAFTDLPTALTWVQTYYTGGSVSDASFKDGIFYFTVPQDSSFADNSGFCSSTTTTQDVKFDDSYGLAEIFANDAFRGNTQDNILMNGIAGTNGLQFGDEAFRGAEPKTKNTIYKMKTVGTGFGNGYTGKFDIRYFAGSGGQDYPNDFFTTSNLSWITTAYSNKYNNSGTPDGDIIVAQMNMTDSNSAVSYDGIDSGGGGGISEAPNDGSNYARNSLTWNAITSFPEAPSDSKYYSRRNATWSVPKLSDLNSAGAGNTLADALFIFKSSSLDFSVFDNDGFYARATNLITQPWAYLKKDGLYLKAGTSSGKVDVLLTGNPNQTATGVVFQTPLIGTAGTYNLVTDTTNVLKEAGSFSQTVTAVTTVTVTLTTAQPDTSYKVNLTPTSLLASTAYYVSSKTTGNFVITYGTALTGAVSGDYTIYHN